MRSASSPSSPPDTRVKVREHQRRIREQVKANCRAQDHKDEFSRVICGKFAQMTEYAAAGTVMWYVDTGEEVRTRHDLPPALTSGKRIVVPYCVDGALKLFHLKSMDELAAGMYGILEPKADLRAQPDRRVEVGALDVVLVPGVAFSRAGARLGRGKGYYDTLLEQVREDTLLVALAFHCQLFPEIPLQEHDILMDRVVTERAVYDGRGRKARVSER